MIHARINIATLQMAAGATSIALLIFGPPTTQAIYTGYLAIVLLVSGFLSAVLVCLENNARDERNRRIVSAIEQLTQEEGQAVTIPNPNPDFGGPNNVITCYRDFEDDEGTSFTGDSLLECLEKAVSAQVKS